jgi:hypothetical protein
MVQGGRRGGTVDAAGAAPPPAAAPCSAGSILDLPPPALAAVAAHLPALDLLRLRLSSKAATAVLDSLPVLYSTACRCALGWPATGQGAALSKSGEGNGSGSGAAAAAASGSGSAVAAAVRGSSSRSSAAASGSAVEASCLEVLRAAAALSAAAGPHSTRPLVRALAPTVAALLGRSGRFSRAGPAGLSPPLLLSEAQQALLALGGPGEAGLAPEGLPISGDACMGARAWPGPRESGPGLRPLPACGHCRRDKAQAAFSCGRWLHL